MLQRDFKKGQKWRVCAHGVHLWGMKPIPGGQQGRQAPAPLSTVLTCAGVCMTFGDGVPVVKWTDANGQWIANDCIMSPAEGGMWSSAPADGTLQPWSINTITVTSANYALDLRSRVEAEMQAEMPDSETAKLMARLAQLPGRWVLWDPESDGDGLLLVGDDPFALADEAVNHLELVA